MQTSYLDIYEELRRLSLQLPALVTQAARKEHAFIDDFTRWLLACEQAMQRHSLPQCAELAGLRARIVAAGYAPGERSASRRTQRLRTAASALDDAQSTLLRVLDPFERRIGAARDAARQMLGVAYQARLITPGTDFATLLQGLWSTFSAHEQLRGLTANLLVHVNRSDALRLLAEEIDLTA